MRTIKFRAWDTTDKIMHTWEQWSKEEKQENFIILNDDYYILMQYIGERDGNYKDIYEGDLIRLDETFNGADENSKIFEVVYLDEDNADEYPTFPNICTYILYNRETKDWIDFQWDDTDYMTVIGNIYEGIKNETI